MSRALAAPTVQCDRHDDHRGERRAERFGEQDAGRDLVRSARATSNEEGHANDHAHREQDHFDAPPRVFRRLSARRAATTTPTV